MLDLKALLSKILNCLTCDLLYDGSFTSGTLTLTNTIANYKSLIFVYTDNDGVLHTQQVIINNASNRNFILDVTRVTSVAYLKNMIININGSALTSNTNRQWAGNTPTTGNYVILNKVYGCKGIVSNGGGYLTSKLYEIFSHLERWWEYVRFKETTNEGVNQSPVVVLQCVRKRLQQLLQGAESWQSCTRLGRILKWLDNHAGWLSCVGNIIATIQTTTERQICMWRIGWNGADNRLRQYEWDCVPIYNNNHCILEFHSNLLCGITLERGCSAC